MALYKTHTKFNIFLTLPIFIFIMYYFLNAHYSLMLTFSICFIYSTYFMNPDLDLANKIKLLSIRGILSLPFRGYSLIFKHRGISHSPFFGTLTRVGYLGSFFYLIILFFDIQLINKNEFINVLKSELFLYGFLGIFFSDISHLILDKISS